MTATPRPSPSRASRAHGLLIFAIGVAALVAFGRDLASEPFFADESAYFSQSYFAATFAERRFDDPRWLDFPGYDLPPLTKYLIGFALRAGGYSTPGPEEAWYWYDHTTARFDPPGALTVARIPIVIVGAVGCLAVYGIGVLAGGRAVGALASALLIVNPLYRLHSRRAMSDVPCEAFLLLALFFGMLAWKRRLEVGNKPAPALDLVSGLCAGLSVLSKLSGVLALMVVAGWATLALFFKASAPTKLKIAAGVAGAGCAALATFVALDPFLTAHPTVTLPPAIAAVDRMSSIERARMMFRLRFRVAAGQKISFAHNALNTPMDKLSVSVVQGFGRFGPFGPSHSDSRTRFEGRQDWGCWIWLPWVSSGAVYAGVRGRSGTPCRWAVLVHFVVAFAVVTAYLPMAWDRYLLPIQAPSCLLASGIAVALIRKAVTAFIGSPPLGAVR